MNKKLLLLLATLLLLCGLAVGVSADSLYIKKIVSVVYDDSGSMLGDKNAYANYAMQTLCGLLNGDKDSNGDQLYVTYMSKPSESIKLELSPDSIQDSVKKIRGNVAKLGVGTPMAAVDKAYETLKSVKGTDANTQYWLVVITDGAFDELNKVEVESTEGESKEDKEERLFEAKRKYLDGYFEEKVLKLDDDHKMPNGSMPKVIFFSINEVGKDEVPTPNSKKDKSLTTYSADRASVSEEEKKDGKKGIVDEMHRIADKISGRSRVNGGDDGTQGDIKYVEYEEDEKTIVVKNSIVVNMKVPILNMVVLSQKSQLEVKSVVIQKETNGTAVDVVKKAKLEYSEKGGKYPELKGTASLMGDSSAVLDAGDYVVTFDKDVANLKDIVVLFEPAIEIKTTFYVNGNKIKSPDELNNLVKGDKISFSYNVYEKDTDNIIDQKKLPDNTKFLTTLTVGDNEEPAMTGKQAIDDYQLTDESIKIKAEFEIDGVNPIVYEKEIAPQKYEVKPVLGVDTVNFDDIGNSDFSLEFEVYKNGTLMKSKEDVKKLNPTVEVLTDGNAGTCTVADNGRIVFTPTSATQTKDNKEYTVTVKCITDKDTCEAAYSIAFSDYAIVPVVNTATVNFDEIDSDSEFAVKFEVYKNGTRMDSKAEVEKLHHSMEVSPEGNVGKDYVDEDGRIVFIPTVAKAETDRKDYTVTVKCTTDKGSGENSYKVVFSQYDVKVLVTDKVIHYRDVEGNTSPIVEFEVYKDKTLIKSKEEVEKLNYTVEVIEPTGNSGKAEVTEDGRIVFIPNAVGGSFDSEDFDVKVMATVENDTAEGIYRVDCSEYKIIPIATQDGIQYDAVPNNKDFFVAFQVEEDSETVTDPEKLKQFNLRVDTDKEGNKGFHKIAEDGSGMIQFFPTSAYTETLSGNYDVNVICELGEHTSGTNTYKVLVAEYDVIPTNADKKVVKTELYGNETGVSFCITKDKTHQLAKEEIDEATIGLQVNEEWRDVILLSEFHISDDGVITVYPYDDVKFEDGFLSWLNFWEYFTYPGEDIEITLITPYGKDTAIVDIVGEDIVYILLWVVLPFLTIVAIIGFILWWLIDAIFFRSHFPEGAALYVAPLTYNEGGGAYKRSIIGCSRRLNLDDITDTFSSIRGFLYRVHPPVALTLDEWSMFPGVRLPKLSTDIKRKVSVGRLDFSAKGSGVRVYSRGKLCDVNSVTFGFTEKGRDERFVNALPAELYEMVLERVNKGGKGVYAPTVQFVEKNENKMGYYTLAPNKYYIVDAEVRTVNKTNIIVGGKLVYYSPKNNTNQKTKIKNRRK